MRLKGQHIFQTGKEHSEWMGWFARSGWLAVTYLHQILTSYIIIAPVSIDIVSKSHPTFAESCFTTQPLMELNGVCYIILFLECKKIDVKKANSETLLI